MKKVIIVGAGLAGSYMAYAMGKKGYEVQVLKNDRTPKIQLRLGKIHQPCRQP